MQFTPLNQASAKLCVLAREIAKRMEADTMKRREFILLLGGASKWPLVEQPGRMRRIGVLMAEQRAIRRVGVLLPGAPADSGHFASAFVQGLKIAGYVDGENVALEYRWAEGRNERLPQLAAELVQSGVAVIAVGGPPATLAAKSAISTVPIVAVMGDADVLLKLVHNFNRPNGNITGVAVFVTAAIWGKRLELLHEMMPRASVVAILTNPNDQGGPTIGELYINHPPHRTDEPVSIGLFVTHKRHCLQQSFNL
jgi:putative ABC transport system substrate-binding protein